MLPIQSDRISTQQPHNRKLDFHIQNLDLITTFLTSAGLLLLNNILEGFSFFDINPSMAGLEPIIAGSGPNYAIQTDSDLVTVGGLFTVIKSPAGANFPPLSKADTFETFDFECQDGNYIPSNFACLYRTSNFELPSNAVVKGDKLFPAIKKIPGHIGISSPNDFWYIELPRALGNTRIISVPCEPIRAFSTASDIVIGIATVIGSAYLGATVATTTFRALGGIKKISKAAQWGITFGSGLLASGLTAAGGFYARQGVTFVVHQTGCFTEQQINSSVRKININRQSIPQNEETLFPIDFVYIGRAGAENVKFKITDSSGNEVKNLKSFLSPAKSIHFETIPWNLKDNLGNLVPNGTYKVVISAEEVLESLTVLEIEIN